MADLLSAIRRLPLEERLLLIAQAISEATTDTRKTPPIEPARCLLGLMADEPDVVDQMCSLVYQARKRSRTLGRESTSNP